MQKNISAAERVKRSGTKSISEGAKEKNWSKLKATNDLLPKEESTTYQLLLRASGTVESVLPVLGWRRGQESRREEEEGRKKERERLWEKKLGRGEYLRQQISRAACKLQQEKSRPQTINSSKP
jgi:hypothetical protein